MKKKLLTLALTSTLISTIHAAELTIAFDADPVSLDPQEHLSQDTMQMANWLFDPLVRLDHELNIIPALAESWEQISPTVTRFHLRKGVTFHSGNPFTADDVIFTFNRIRTSGDFKGLFSAYEGIEKVDDYTVDFITKQPYPLVLANMRTLFIMDKDFYSGEDEQGKDKSRIEKSTGTFASVNASGTGAFTIESRQQGVKSVYVKNPNYWDETGNIDKFTFVPIKENATRIAALLSGDVDWIYPVPPTDLERVDAAQDFTLYSIPSDRIITLQLNQKVVEPFKDKRVRQAVIYAINNPAITERILRGYAEPAAQNSPQGYSGHNDSLEPRYDLEKAKQLMKEAGYEDGFTITMIAPNNRYVNDEKIAQAVVAMLAKINIKVNLTTMPKAQYWGEFAKCENGIQMLGWGSNTADSAYYSEYLTMTRDDDQGVGSYNCNGSSNAELDALIHKANTMQAGEERNALLHKVGQIEYDEALYVPLHWESLNWGYNNKISNFPEVVNLKNFPLFQKVIVKE
ncbi:ABC transporter substrate-binding protein [Cardiobacteriaceae bacterium TAE3-ERU3]|nr:ABC transporter substrate-binding protein [Cardiobacteriaceae bacterium TAE3-ERU3]